MVQATIAKTRLTIEFQGLGDKSGGSYTLSNIKPGAADDKLYETAYAINELQTDFAKRIYKSVETILSEE